MPTTLMLGLAVLLANAGLLVLQLIAGRIIAPFVGSSVETWTATIAAFLGGIALGNFVGGRLATRDPGRWPLPAALCAGAVTSLLLVGVPKLLNATRLHESLPLGLRIPILALCLGMPVAFALSLPTPIVIRRGTHNLRQAGRIAGMVFALGTLGSVVGNYAAGFWLIPNFHLNSIILGIAAILGTFAIFTTLIPPVSSAKRDTQPATLRMERSDLLSVVFIASFVGMMLELTATRLLAQVVGMSLYTWTGVIGVMLVGTALGNFLGGIIADRATPENRQPRLALLLMWIAMFNLLILVLFAIGTRTEPVLAWPLPWRVVAWSFTLFFLPMLALGTVTPQVVRICITDVDHSGQVAGRIYAVSMLGAIVGTLLTGFVLLSQLGMYRTILLAVVLPTILVLKLVAVREKPLWLYTVSGVLGCVLGGLLLLRPETTGITAESNYFTISVKPTREPTRRPMENGIEAAMAVVGPLGLFDPPGTVLQLQLDRLVHSWVKLDDPTYLMYEHEQTQMELLRAIDGRLSTEPRVLVIGGGGYTFPRAARAEFPNAEIDVVEIDPAVTGVSINKLGFDPNSNIHTFHMDGRQYINELAKPNHYDLILLDAVNDLSIPWHLLTVEFHEALRTTLKPDGVYLLSVIDILDDGLLWKSTVATLKQSFQHVMVLNPQELYEPDKQHVYVIYACDKPLPQLQRTTLLPEADRQRWLAEPAPILTDQYAPIERMMAELFRRRTE